MLERTQVSKLFSASATLLLCVATAAAQDRPVISGVSALTASNAPICPGCLVTLMGSALGPVDPATLNYNQPDGLPAVIAGVYVTFNGMAAPLASVSATRIIAVAPFGLDSAMPAQVQVTNQDAQSDVFAAPIVNVVPGVLTLSDSGLGQVFASNADGTPNSLTSPAALGSTITLYASGLGQTNPALIDGQSSSDAFPILEALTVQVGGKPATVLSATAAPGFVAGYYQIVLRVPPELIYQGQYEVIVNVGGLPSQSGARLAVDGPPPPIPPESP